MKSSAFLTFVSFILLACQDPNFQGEGQARVEGETEAVDTERSVVIEDFQVTEPVQVGGAFLYCYHNQESPLAASVSCSLTNDSGPVEIQGDVDVTFSTMDGDGRVQMIEAQENDSRNMWQIEVASDRQPDMIAMTLSQGPWQKSFATEFPKIAILELGAFRLGDNDYGTESTVVQPNPCLSLETGHSRRNWGEVLSIELTVNEPSKANIQVVGACGTELETGASLQIFNQNDDLVAGFAILNGDSDWLSIPELEAGVYQIRFSPRQKSPTDFDDFLGANLIISGAAKSLQIAAPEFTPNSFQ
ncbi:hypothetical protein [Pseudobacteriovorax antillogorgiicola]|uniref:Uncharacterized protein n=1 Tax=Pseudobacteriovorax antillogorgiicola TaxID=1513793 RepID=A0A1Y6BJQ5_9BACT|nr:hypothetical protein [Pseudobacteriovorax antillogorgiicola]TCS55289.1 hypothetical protein EDD56_10510 [Pseudobacteriovorax antillogorgiicola]SMF14727.1 hypothetical protein SAMN06296036_105314 [Pseudobacteriovorax antillogorgiicola]